MSSDSVAQDQIKAYVDLMLRLKDESKALAADIREIYAEAKGNGFDKTVLGKIVNYVEKLQADASAIMESEALFELYLTAYDGRSGRVGTDRATHTHASEDADDGEDSSDSVQARIAALKANPSMAIVAPSEIKSQPAPQAGSDLTTPQALTGQVAPPSQKAAGETIPSDQPQARPEVSPEISGKPEATLPLETATEVLSGSDADKSVEAPASAAPVPLYAEPGVITWEVAPPEGVERHQYSMIFGTLGQDIAVIEDDMKNASSEPIVKIGKVILDGWARYMAARAIGIEYPVRQYDGTDPLIDCIKWNFEGRLLTSEQKFRIAHAFAKAEPKRKADIYAAMELGMELVS